MYFRLQHGSDTQNDQTLVGHLKSISMSERSLQLSHT